MSRGWWMIRWSKIYVSKGVGHEMVDVNIPRHAVQLRKRYILSELSLCFWESVESPWVFFKAWFLRSVWWTTSMGFYLGITSGENQKGYLTSPRHWKTRCQDRILVLLCCIFSYMSKYNDPLVKKIRCPWMARRFHRCLQVDSRLILRLDFRRDHLRFTTTRSRSIILAPSPTALTSSTGKRFLRLASAGSELKTRLFWILSLGCYLLEKKESTSHKNKNPPTKKQTWPSNFKLQTSTTTASNKKNPTTKTMPFQGDAQKHPGGLQGPWVSRGFCCD